MVVKYVSPFKPKSFIKYKPLYFKIYTFNAGFKKYNKDLLVIIFDKLVTRSAVYTKSTTPSASIIWNKSIEKNLCRVLIINSGNANAFTGAKGLNAIKNYTRVASKLFKCKQNEVFVSSTGVIGEQLNADKIINKLNLIKKSRSKNIYDAAKAIMTTDTFPKIVETVIQLNNKKIKIFGIAKGSGMIAPNMGTMLSYIFIEAALNKSQLNMILKQHVEDTFNSISIDGDTSTNDTVMLFSLKNKQKFLEINDKIIEYISIGVKNVMLDLSKKIVSDGEGISKLIEVSVIKAKTKIQASKIGFSIAESLLVKTAVYGEDPNWGRIIMAIGKVNEKIDPNKLIIKFGNLTVAKSGMMYKKINFRKLEQYMKNKIIKISVDLNIGKQNKTVWSTDLTNKYININADYTS